jgi:acetyl esterase/lipase
MNILKLLGGCFFLALASLTTYSAPSAQMWTATLAATEFGYWIAALAILPLIPTPGGTKVGKLGALLSAGAIVLFLMPVAKAREMSAELPSAFKARFGDEVRTRSLEAEYARAEPMVLPELVRGPSLPPIRYEERVFTTHGDQSLTLDVYRPKYEHGPLPGVIVIHGGNWQEGNNGQFLSLNSYLASRDFVVAAINYRLAPKWKFPAARDDVYAAIAHLKVHGPEFGLDPTRLVILGRGAGGQLALLAAYTAGEPAIRGAISLYGPTDLRYEYENAAARTVVNSRQLLENFLGGPPSSAADAYAAASPINFVTAATPPTLLIHGMRDNVVPAEESVRLESKLQDAGVKHMFVRMPWATHACDRSWGGPCGQIATYAVERFLDAVMIAPPEPEGAKKKKPAPRAQPGAPTKSARR